MDVFITFFHVFVLLQNVLYIFIKMRHGRYWTYNFVCKREKNYAMVMKHFSKEHR